MVTISVQQVADLSLNDSQMCPSLTSGTERLYHFVIWAGFPVHSCLVALSLNWKMHV